jgi:hypothetical protein
MDQKTRHRVYAAFSRFAESIDALIVLLRDEYFHVRSKAKPRGMFDVPVNAVFLALARSIAQSCPSIEDYAKHCIHMFWVLLAAKMTAARPPLVHEASRAVNGAFEKLVQELRSSGIRDVDLHATLQQALEDLRRRVVAIGTWMRVSKASIEGRTFSMQRIVDVAVALVKGQRPSFKPLISATVPENLALDYYGFSIVVDMLYIGIDNVYEHSGKKVDNNIRIDVRFDKERTLLSFEILSELGKGGRTPEKEARLAAIRNNIAKKAYVDSARKDRNSGLSKLAALVLQSEHTSISFDFVERTHFLLKFDLHYVEAVPGSVRDHVDDLIS